MPDAVEVPQGKPLGSGLFVKKRGKSEANRVPKSDVLKHFVSIFLIFDVFEREILPIGLGLRQRLYDTEKPAESGRDGASYSSQEPTDKIAHSATVDAPPTERL